MSRHILPPLLIPLLKRLSDSRFHSGQDMAAHFRVSRATIFNLLQTAEQQGVRIHAVRGKGYRLAERLSWLDEAELQAMLAASGHGYVLKSVEETRSTNSLLTQEALAGAAHRTVLYADYQHAGRGRRGRSWQSPLGGGLTFSVLWRFERGMDQLSGLSIAVGLALARALAGRCPLPVKLKWPNDVLAGYRKLAGILVEVQGELAGPSFAVIGIGVNEHLPARHRQEIDQAVVDLAEMGVNISRSELLHAILSELARIMAVFEQEGIRPILAEWPHWHAHEGRAVSLSTPDGHRHTGTACGLDEAGNLLLALPGGEMRKFSAGEVSLRPASAK
jgi:BirA family biotin operon repressor/biotin-[acetyl-CoA-carboxylase] ligase